jgi:flagellar basal-body rod protein FlgB
MPQSVINKLEDMLEFCTQKQKVLSRNIANIGTKDYQREEVKFKDVLDSSMLPELKTSDPEHFSTFTPESEVNNFEIVRDDSTDKVSGINNVDIDKEMTEMVENTLKFKFAARKIGDYYKLLQEVIRSGGSA